MIASSSAILPNAAAAPASASSFDPAYVTIRVFTPISSRVNSNRVNGFAQPTRKRMKTAINPTTMLLCPALIIPALLAACQPDKQTAKPADAQPQNTAPQPTKAP